MGCIGWLVALVAAFLMRHLLYRIIVGLFKFSIFVIVVTFILLIVFSR